MNFSSLKLWDYGTGDESVDNKTTTGTEVGGLLPRLEFALKSAINLSKSSPTKTCHLFAFNFPAERVLRI